MACRVPAFKGGLVTQSFLFAEFNQILNDEVRDLLKKININNLGDQLLTQIIYVGWMDSESASKVE